MSFINSILDFLLVFLLKYSIYLILIWDITTIVITNCDLIIELRNSICIVFVWGMQGKIAVRMQRT